MPTAGNGSARIRFSMSSITSEACAFATRTVADPISLALSRSRATSAFKAASSSWADDVCTSLVSSNSLTDARASSTRGASELLSAPGDEEGTVPVAMDVVGAEIGLPVAMPRMKAAQGKMVRSKRN